MLFISIYFKILYYNYNVQSDITKIKNIDISPDFKFISQNIIYLIGISLIANLFMNNLQFIDEKYDTLLNKTIYINNSSFSTSISFNLKYPE